MLGQAGLFPEGLLLPGWRDLRANPTRTACGSWLPRSAHPVLGSQPRLAPPAPAKHWHRAAALNNSVFVLATEHTRVCAEAPCPSGCGTRSPLPPRCSVTLAAQPWRRCFHSLPAWHGREGEQWRGSQPRSSLCVCVAAGSPWHTCSLCCWVWMLKLEQAGSCCAVRHRPSESCRFGKEPSPPLPAPLSVCASICLPTPCVGCPGLESGQVCLAGALGWDHAALSWVLGPLSPPLHSELSVGGLEVAAGLVVPLWSSWPSPPWTCCLCQGWFISMGRREMGLVLVLIILQAPGQPVFSPCWL